MTQPAASLKPAQTSTAHPVVLQLIPELESGSAARSCVDVALFLARAGGRSLVASRGGRLVHELERAGIPHFGLPLASRNPLTLHANSQRLASLIRDYRVDILHARAPGPAWSAFLATRQTGCAFLTSFQQPYAFATRGRKFFNSVMARGDRVIAGSQFLANHVVDVYGTPSARLRLVARGIDLFRFNPDHVTAERMARLSQDWRLPDGLKVVLCPGRLIRSKGQLELLRALAALPRRDFICVLAGPDQGEPDYVEALERAALELGLEGHVTMVGDCQDMPTAYMLADVVVAPSIIPEGFGRIVVEAQAMGRPVVASHLGGMAETIVPGETGWLVEAGHPDALAGALAEALDLTLEQRQRLGARSVSHIHAHFSRDQMGWQTLDVYAELAGQPVPWALATGT